MAAETVAAYAPISFHQDSIGYGIDHGIKSGSDDEAENRRNYFRTDLRNNESDDARDRPFARNHVEISNFDSTGNENINSSVNDSQPNSKMNGHDMKGVENKRRRNIRKRNRSDMSPEELRKLRERERKAQQNRRDRIRAQKRQAQGWHDDDAAWEAFLDQTDNNSNDSGTKRSSKKQSSMPSMVCSMSPHKMPLEILNNHKVLKEVESTGSPFSMIHDEESMKKIQKQDSVMSNDTDSNPGGVYSDPPNLILYGSDENMTEAGQNDINGRRVSRRQFLPSEELEKLRKRERDAKRKQRERHRLAHGSSPSLVKEDGSRSPVSSEASPSETSYDKIQNEKGQQESDPKIQSDAQLSPRSHLTPPIFHKISPRDHHIPPPHHMHYPMVYMPDTHRHHYSPTSHYFRERHNYPDLYYPRHLSDDPHLHKDENKPDIHHHPYHDFHKNNLVSPRSFHPVHHPHTIPSSTSPPEKQGTEESDSSPPEKKKMISRNVDRKKLTEDQLEELRRRERDYQRERRARIRIEKAKSQATHDQYQQKVRDESFSHYYHHSPIYHHHPHDKLPHHMIGRYESIERQDYHRHSPHYTAIKHEDDIDSAKEYLHKQTKELEVSIPTERTYSSQKETELLQVVPKTRECEEFKLKTISPKSDNANSLPPESKKNVLENICSTLKKESPDWNENMDDDDNDDADNDDDNKDDDDEDEDDEKLVIVQPNTETDLKETSFNSQDNEERLSMLKEQFREFHHTSKNYNVELMRVLDDTVARERITEDQLERRRRSNREAQRRRRARLKMLGNADDRSDSLNNSNDSNDNDINKERNKLPNGSSYGEDMEQSRKTCRVKVTPARPDSLYDSRPDDIHPHHMHHGNKYDDHHKYYNEDQYSSYNEKHLLHPPRYSIRDFDDLHHGHMFHDPPSYISERYPHEYQEHHHYHRHAHGHSMHMSRHRQHRHHSPEGHTDLPRDHIDIVPRKISSMDESNSPSPIKTEADTELEPLKQSGRKRKQFAPRKVIASASNSPDEDVDVCNISRSPEEENNTLNKVTDISSVVFDEVIVGDQNTQ